MRGLKYTPGWMPYSWGMWKRPSWGVTAGETSGVKLFCYTKPLACIVKTQRQAYRFGLPQLIDDLGAHLGIELAEEARGGFAMQFCRIRGRRDHLRLTRRGRAVGHAVVGLVPALEGHLHAHVEVRLLRVMLVLALADGDETGLLLATAVEDGQTQGVDIEVEINEAAEILLADGGHIAVLLFWLRPVLAGCLIHRMGWREVK